MTDNDQLQHIAHLRREYTKGGLRRADLPADPLTLFERWLGQACEAQLADPTAMVVATVDEQGQPYQRIVLLKHYDEKGLVFYTNLGSRKAQHLEHNPAISLLFPWHMLERQVMVTGKAERLSTLEVVKAADEIGQDFLFAYQRAVLLALQRQGVLNEMQCRNCVQKLEEQIRNTGKSKSVKE